MTLTYPGLARTAGIVWLVTGEDKRDALKRLLAGDLSIPAGRVEAKRSVIVADAAAGGGPEVTMTEPTTQAGAWDEARPFV